MEKQEALHILECMSITLIIKHAECLAVPHYLINSKIFGKKATEHKCTF